MLLHWTILPTSTNEENKVILEKGAHIWRHWILKNQLTLTTIHIYYCLHTKESTLASANLQTDKQTDKPTVYYNSLVHGAED